MEQTSTPGPGDNRPMRFDFEDTFGDDDLYFYASVLTADRNDRDTHDIVALLGLRGGERVLDAPCGHGRIASRLAQRGITVVGVDRSELFLDVARQQSPAVEYHHGDLRHLPVAGPFDAALCWFTSFGYFEDDDNQRVLAEYHRVLHPGGRLLMELPNHDQFVRHFTTAPFSHSVQVGEDLMIDTTSFDCITGRIETDHLVVRYGQVRRSHHSVRVPTIPELRRWPTDAGFATIEFQARDGQEPNIYRPCLVVIATA
jgi:ubiquinone/menaquinone biosynthesis C-methylase UbiE